MEVHPEAERHHEPGGDEEHVHDGERGDRVHRARRPHRDDERADHLGPGSEQVIEYSRTKVRNDPERSGLGFLLITQDEKTGKLCSYVRMCDLP